MRSGFVSKAGSTTSRAGNLMNVFNIYNNILLVLVVGRFSWLSSPDLVASAICDVTECSQSKGNITHPFSKPLILPHWGCARVGGYSSCLLVVSTEHPRSDGRGTNFVFPLSDCDRTHIFLQIDNFLKCLCNSGLSSGLTKAITLEHSLFMFIMSTFLERNNRSKSS